MTSLSRSLRLRSANAPVLLAVTSAGLFLAALDAYVVVAALVSMLTSVKIPLLPVSNLARATPIITGFLLGYLAAMPLAGSLSDRFGRLRVFAACLVLFGFGSLLTATAGNLGQLVTGRLLQGAGGGALVPVVLALAADLSPARGRASVLGGVSSLQEIGSVLGPLWGGLLAATGSAGWRWIFWINLPVVALILWVLWPGIRRGERNAPARASAGRIDWLGAALAGAGLALLTLALYADRPDQSPVSPGFLWEFPAALLFFALFVWHERLSPHPMIDIRHFRDLGFTGAALTNGLAGAALMVALIFIPVIAESQIFSMNARQAALLLFRLLLGIPVGALLGGLLATRLRSNRGVAAIGMLLAAIGLYLLSGWDQNALAYPLVGPVRRADAELFLTGLGLGLEIAPVSAALLDLVGDTERGAAASFLVIMRLCGMLVGFSAVAGYGLYHFDQVTEHLTPPVFSLNLNFGLQQAAYLVKLRAAILDEYHTVFSAAAILAMVGAVIAAGTLRPLRPRDF